MVAGFDRLEHLMLAAEAPAVVDIPGRLAAAIYVTIPRSEIQTVMGPALMEVTRALQAQGVEPAGPWFTHHLRLDPHTFDFEVCVPVARPIQTSGRVEMREFPPARVARTVYRGSYEGLGTAWGQFMTWIDANEHTSAGDFFECYAAGPETSADPSEWRTELLRPLQG